jgi:hypothetical protein
VGRTLHVGVISNSQVEWGRGKVRARGGRRSTCGLGALASTARVLECRLGGRSVERELRYAVYIEVRAALSTPHFSGRHSGPRSSLRSLSLNSLFRRTTHLFGSPFASWCASRPQRRSRLSNIRLFSPNGAGPCAIDRSRHSLTACAMLPRPLNTARSSTYAHASRGDRFHAMPAYPNTLAALDPPGADR